MPIPLYPQGNTSLLRSPEGHNTRDARRIKLGGMETDRDLLWRTIVSRLDGSLITEALYFKLQQARAEELAVLLKDTGGDQRGDRDDSSMSDVSTHDRRNSGLPEDPLNGPKKKVDWLCIGSGWWKMKPSAHMPVSSDPNFLPGTKNLMQPDVPPTRRQQLIAILCGVLASILLGMSVGIVKVLRYRYKNPIELILFYQFGGMTLTAMPPFLFYRYVSGRQVAIWGRLIGDDQYINYKRGVMCSCRALCGIGGLICEYYALYFMVPGDTSLIIFTAPITGALGAMMFKKRPKEPILFILALIPPIGFALIMQPQSNENLIYYPTLRTSGLALGIVGMISIAINQYMLRFLRYVHWSITQFVYGVSGFCLSVTVIFLSQTKVLIPMGEEVIWFLGFLYCSFIGEILWQRAHKYLGIASLGAIRFLVETTVLYVIEVSLFGWTPAFYVGVGAGILILPISLWTLKEALTEAHET